MEQENVTPSVARNEAGNCDFCGRTPSQAGYTLNYQNGQTLCSECRNTTNYNGGF